MLTTLRFAINSYSDTSSYSQQPVSSDLLTKEYGWSIFAYHNKYLIELSKQQILV